MRAHYSLRGILAAVAIMATAAGDAAKAKGEPPPRMPRIALPAELQGKRRKGMSAKSSYSTWKGAGAEVNRRLKTASGPGSYGELSGRERMRQGREMAAARKANREAHK